MVGDWNIDLLKTIVIRKDIVWKHGPYIMGFYCSWKLTGGAGQFNSIQFFSLI